VRGLPDHLGGYACEALALLEGERLDRLGVGLVALGGVVDEGAVREAGVDVVRRGSMTKSRAPLCTPLSRWWKKIGCVSRAFDPQRRITSVSSISA
jgi:hypothetical protein